MKKAIGIGIDYKRYNIKDRKILEKVPLTLKRASDTDNSNTLHDGEITFIRINSPRGIAHQIIISLVGIGPVPFMYIEEYMAGQGLSGSIGRIDFYGAFFHFKDFIPVRYIKIYDLLQEESKKASVRTTRKDISIDIDFEFPQNGGSWIIPSKNSKRDVSCWRHKNLYNSYGYLSKKNSGYGVRIYNKLVDIEKHGKERWYGGKEHLPKNWMRIEFEFYPPYSLKSDEELLKLSWARVTGSYDIFLGMTFRPCIKFEVENSYNYFTRYAKTHGISVEQLIDEIVAYHIFIEEKKEIYGLVEENE